MRLPLLALALLAIAIPAAAAELNVGVAAVDITPDYPVRLSGFGFRRTESEGVSQHIWAKAIAFKGTGNDGPAVIVTVDNLGIPIGMTRDVAGRLAQKAKLDPARFAVTASHTHTAPMLKDVCPTLFGVPIPPEHQERIDRYTKELADNLEKVCLAALADLRPAKVEFGIGSATLAANRRTKGGPVDHDLPVLVVRDEAGKPRAIYVSYACHCVTLSDNKISGDWAGYVQETVQKNYPGVIALTSIGCGADSNPSSGVTGDKYDVAAEQGKQIASEIDRLLKQSLTSITKPVATRTGEVELLFDTHPTREQWQEKANRPDAVGHHARVQLAKLDRGEQLMTRLPYPIQTWAFGDQLAMVFLPGEVVVDYSLRLKKEFDRSRLWVNAYSNDAPCYIPSERILKEGGYEGEGAMVYYDKPTRLAPGVEQKIIDEVRRQVPAGFVAPKGTEGVPPKTPEQSRQSIRTKPGLEVELVAAEPLVTSPVAIDWSADGRLWVCEMFDYPAGADGDFRPGGRVKLLEDTNRDGRYDKATVFLDHIPFPTGVTAWGRGVFVCAAPDILFAQDTDADGRADKVEKLFTGFYTDNFQARVNSLSLGLDNWMYGANGLLGGIIADREGRKLDIRNRDFRFRPVGGPMETVAGLTQQGRVRDDWGRWFGCDNSTSLLYYPHEERYLRRNPHAPSPAMVVRPPADYDVGRVYPGSRLLDRFNDPDNANRFTSACGLGIYRDTLLGAEVHGNALVCEPVHNLVHRMIVTGNGTSLSRRRADDEREAEFFASTDNWSRPVQVRTGPDGALYVVDMYRFLIEHPRWIAANRLAQIDVRAGADKGRIYRLRPSGVPLRPVRDLTALGAAELASALATPNGTERDRVHVELLVRHDGAAVPFLEKLALASATSPVRLQALCALDGLGPLSPALLGKALQDKDERVRAGAVRLCEKDPGAVATALLRMTQDPSPVVRRQLAYTLGEWSDVRAGLALAELARSGLNDADMRVAVLSSAGRHCAPVLAAIIEAPEDRPGRAEWLPPLVATATASKDQKLMNSAVAAALPRSNRAPAAEHFAAVASIADALERAGGSLDPGVSGVSATLAAARRVAYDDTSPPTARAAALRLVARGVASDGEIELLCNLAARGGADTLGTAALSALRRQTAHSIAARLIADWQKTSPAARGDLVQLLLGREQWAAALLDAVKRGDVPRNEVSLADRQRLAASSDERLRTLAVDVFPPQLDGSRAEVVGRFKTVSTLTGEPSRGAGFFARDCAACHSLAGVGHPVGPDLSALRDKDADYFVQNILDPAAVVEPRFVYYQLVTKDRRSITGVIKSETESAITLQGGNGVTETVARADVKEVRAAGTSMMPEGFEAAYTPQQMADLVAFLKSSRQRRQFPGNTPEMIIQSSEGALMLPAHKAEIYGDQVVLETEFRNIGYWYGAGDHAVWTVQVNKPAEYDVYFDYACAAYAAGNRFVLDAGGRTVSGVVEATGGDWSRYVQTKVGTLKLDAGQHRVTVRPEGTPREALIDLRTIALAPSDAKPAWAIAAAPLAASQAPPGDEVARNPAAVAKVILDKSLSNEAREAAVRANPQFAAELIAEMTRELTAGTTAEYERIPWIWRVAVACGRRDDAGQMKKVLAVSLPGEEQPLRDWQAVVIGGGIINGASDRGHWPAQRVTEVLVGDEALLKRYRRSLDLASAMTDDEKVPAPTRYDALRMLGAEPWEKRGAQLARYLAKGTHEELQAGAIAGVGDVDSPGATAALIAALPHLEGNNRNAALDKLLRNEQRAASLAEAIDAGRIDRSWLGEARAKKLAELRKPR